MAVMSQNLVPVHIAFIPLIVPPLLSVLNKMQVDRRLITCVLTLAWLPPISSFRLVSAIFI